MSDTVAGWTVGEENESNADVVLNGIERFSIKTGHLGHPFAGDLARRVVAFFNACGSVSTEELEKHGANAVVASVAIRELKAANLNRVLNNEMDAARLRKAGYTVTPPSRSDMSDKVSRALASITPAENEATVRKIIGEE